MTRTGPFCEALGITTDSAKDYLELPLHERQKLTGNQAGLYTHKHTALTFARTEQAKLHVQTATDESLAYMGLKHKNRPFSVHITPEDSLYPSWQADENSHRSLEAAVADAVTFLHRTGHTREDEDRDRIYSMAFKRELASVLEDTAHAMAAAGIDPETAERVADRVARMNNLK